MTADSTRWHPCSECQQLLPAMTPAEDFAAHMEAEETWGPVNHPLAIVCHNCWCTYYDPDRKVLSEAGRMELMARQLSATC
jgi:hypothetical protein